MTRIKTALGQSGQLSLARHLPVGPDLLIREGDQISGSAHIRTAVPCGGSIQADFACYDHNSQLVGLYHIVPQTTASDRTWRQYTAQFAVPPGTTQLSVSFRIDAGQGWGVGSLYVDNVQVTKETAEIPAPPVDAIPMVLWNCPGCDEVYSVRRYGCYMVDPDDYAYIRTYDTYNADAPVFLRQLHAATAGPSHSALLDPIGYDWIEAHRPEWFLLDENGQRISHRSDPDIFMLDPGNQAYQRVWVETAIRNAPWNEPPWSAWMQLLDGHQYELFCDGAVCYPETYDNWKDLLDSYRMFPDKIYMHTVSHPQDDDTVMFDLASFLLACGPSSYLGFRETAGPYPRYHPFLDISVGDPLGEPEEVAYRTFHRSFEYGEVYLNADPNNDTTVQIPPDVEDVYGEPVPEGPRELGPRQGLVLLRPDGEVVPPQVRIDLLAGTGGFEYCADVSWNVYGHLDYDFDSESAYVGDYRSTFSLSLIHI